VESLNNIQHFQQLVPIAIINGCLYILNFANIHPSNLESKTFCSFIIQNIGYKNNNQRVYVTFSVPAILLNMKFKDFHK